MNEIIFMHVTNSINLFIGMTSEEVSCLADSATMHAILSEKHYFTNFVPKNAPLTTLSGPSNLIEGYRNACIMLSNGTTLTIKEPLYSPHSGRTLLSFRDIRDNQYHVETTEENDSEFLCITFYEYGRKRIHEKLERLLSGLYITTIRAVETHHVAGPVAGFQDTLLFCHDRMGHPERDMIRRILKVSFGHHLKSYPGHPLCKACFLGKLNIQPSITKIIHDPP